LNSQMMGRKAKVKASSGGATHSAVFSGRAIARFLGTSSPRITWRAVMIPKARATAVPWVATVASPEGRPSKSPSKR
jgi:hypothetical protein